MKQSVDSTANSFYKNSIANGFRDMNILTDNTFTTIPRPETGMITYTADTLGISDVK